MLRWQGSPEFHSYMPRSLAKSSALENWKPCLVQEPHKKTLESWKLCFVLEPHEKCTWELETMFIQEPHKKHLRFGNHVLFKSMLKKKKKNILGFTATFLCLWWNISTMSVTKLFRKIHSVCHLLTESLCSADASISFQVWTTSNLCLVTVSLFEKNQNYTAKAGLSLNQMLAIHRSFTGCRSQKGSFSFCFFDGTLQPYKQSVGVHSTSYFPF